ncbi:hypothetical protein [Butyrivibrio sp. AC2005]|uniref:hypothetical protein n=1 Tax=Butyrivibrio sp. AC2005 TaxID=1280672 RepID=UPI0003F866F4|nr:hypothetical protein [Butyrivibrio sp. AC2005]
MNETINNPEVSQGTTTTEEIDKPIILERITMAPALIALSTDSNNTKIPEPVTSDSSQEASNLTPPAPLPAEEQQSQPEPFSFHGFQVVRGEFFAHLFEPSVTFKDEKVSVNAACIRKLPTVEYVQFLVHPEKKMLAVKPCSEDSRDSFRWCSPAGTLKKRKPKTITCRVFYAKVMELMGWNKDYRYKILGKLVCTPSDKIFIFDLASSEAYKRKQKDDSAPDTKPRYSADWKDQFGVPIENHDDGFNLSIFDDSTVFRIEREEKNNSEENAYE